jgi:hypothetical protein
MRIVVTNLLFQLLISILAVSNLLNAQTLRELEIASIQNPPTIPVFVDYPDFAAVVIQSTIPNLSVTSNLDIVANLGDPSSGRYIIIIRPFRQLLTFKAPGYIEITQQVALYEPRLVAYYNVNPKDNLITETGNVVIRSSPPGARIAIAGIPGEFTTPHTFTNLLAQTYTVSVSMDDYATEEFQLRVDPNLATLKDVELKPSFGFYQISKSGWTLYLKSNDTDSEFRQSYNSNTLNQLPIGDYEYRLTKQYFRDHVGDLKIEPGETSQIDPIEIPDYATLIVKTNTNQVLLSASDNNAPISEDPNTIFLERGLRRVLIESDGYSPRTLTIQARENVTIDTTITLLTISESENQERLSSLPKGIINIKSDVDAEIFVDGDRVGKQTASLALVPGEYNVELRHELGTKKKKIRVQSAEIVATEFTLRPSKPKTLTFASLVPGLGHIYTKRSRGYIYLAAFLGAGASGYLNMSKKKQLESDHERVFSQYQSASSLEEAARLRIESEQLINDSISSHNNSMYSLYALGTVYLLQLVDALITTPKFGFDGDVVSNLSFRVDQKQQLLATQDKLPPVRFTLTYNF